MMEMKIITILNVYLFFRRFIQTALFIVSTAVLIMVLLPTLAAHRSLFVSSKIKEWYSNLLVCPLGHPS